MYISKDGDVFAFIPIIGDQDWLQPGASALTYQIMIGFEIVAIIYNTLFATLSIGIWRSTSVFHRNMLNLGIVLYFNAYLHLLSRTILFLVQFKLLLPNEETFASLPNIIIILASVVRTYQGSIVMILFGSFVIERIFATIFLNDYERKNRYWISYGLITITVLVSTGITVSRTFNSAVITTKIFNTIQYAYAFIPSMIGVVIVIYNYRRLNRILISPRYSLGVKFQLQENMRAFKFLLFCMAWAVITIAVAGAIFQYMNLHQDDLNIVTICGAAFETVTTIIYALSVSTTFFSIRELRSAMRTKVERLFLCRHHPPDSEDVVPPRQPPSLKGKRVEKESDIYFVDLAVSWSKRLQAIEAKRRKS